MNLQYAVDRLCQTGWKPQQEIELETLPDGRPFPGLLAVQNEFARAGLELAIKHNVTFNCYRATWAPIAEPIDADHEPDECHGTVIGSCQHEAAVYALAQLRASQQARQLAMA
jgi:hypothetical protein